MNIRSTLMLLTIVLFSLTALSPSAEGQQKLTKTQVSIAYTNIAVQMKTFATALDMYKSDKGSYPKSLSAIYPDYLKSPDKNAVKDKFFDYLPSKDGKSFVLSFNQGGPPGIQVPAGYPRYDSTKGALEFMPGIKSLTEFVDKIVP